MSEFRADLHCHTTCSDGSLTPKQIVRHAVDLGLQGLSITDHDTVEAYVEATPEAEKLGLKLIPGAEFSANMDGISIHILAYSFSPTNPLMQDFCQRHKLRRQNRNRAILEKLAKKGMTISEEELNNSQSIPHHSIGRPHIALEMVRKGYVSSLQEAFKRFIGESAPCYDVGESFSVQETIELIHAVQGLAVIAHPHLVNKREIIHKLLKFPFDGIECFYSRFSPEDHKRWVEIAEKKQWLVTGGSDFHGDIKPNVALGCSWISEEPFNILLQHYLSHS